LISKGKKIDLNDTILIAGSPRSGTTWLMEIFENIPGYTYLFEPLQPEWFPDSIKAGFKGRPYLPENQSFQDGEKYLKKIFSGQIVSQIPPYSYNAKMTINRLLNKKLIVKSVRLNRSLPWIHNKFKLRKIIFIIRHPCAVIDSQLKTGFTGYHEYQPPYQNRFPTKKEIIAEASNIDILDKTLIKRLEKIKKLEEMLAACWCLDNYIPLYKLNSEKWNIVIYEKLMTDGESIIKYLFNEIGEKNTIDLAIRFLNKPSMLTLGKDPKRGINTNIQLSKWKKSLSSDKIKLILSLVEDFGFDFYTEKIEPDYANIRFKIIK